MTAITPEAINGSLMRATPFSSVMSRLALLLEDHPGRASWWVELARQLDDLADAVQVAPGDLAGNSSFTEQLRDDAPHLMGRWLRLSSERDGLQDAVTGVRLQLGRDAGDPTAVESITGSIRELMARARRFQERSTEVMLDAYERDFGGGE